MLSHISWGKKLICFNNSANVCQAKIDVFGEPSVINWDFKIVQTWIMSVGWFFDEMKDKIFENTLPLKTIFL